MTLTYIDITIFFITILIVRIIWYVSFDRRYFEKQKLQFARRMFHLGKVEGSNQIHACQNPEWGIKEKSFDEYLAEEQNEKSISNNN